MRILVVTNDLPPRVGGIQYYVDQLARGLVAAGDEVTLFGSTWDGAEEFDATAPYRVVRHPVRTLLPTPRVARRVALLVRSTGAEVVVFGAAFPLGLMGPRLRRRTGVPYAAFTHGLEVSVVRGPGGARFLRHIGRDAALVTFVSNWCDGLLRPAFGPGPRYALLPPAVDPSEYHAGVDGSAVRHQHGLVGRPLVVTVSRLVARKGQDTLIRALPAIRRQVPGAALLVVGGGEHREELERLARRCGVAGDVVFAGQVPDAELPAHYAAGDVFAFPTRERRRGLEVEAFGIVVIQAEGVGVPAVAGRIGGVPDAVGAPDAGVLVDGTDVDEVAREVGELLADRPRRERMGAAAAARVADGYAWPARVEELRALLHAATATTPGE
ncbi:MAG: glycosyltransferase family 4 protein [Microthrixaceae bacterium]